MIKPPFFDQTQASDGSSESVTPGGHICKIMKANVEKTRNNNDMLVLFIDIAEGSPLDGIYRRKFDSRRATNADAKWQGIYRQPVVGSDGKCSPYFKGLCKAIDESNPGLNFTASLDERLLAGKMIGMVFREEEYLNQSSGEIKVSVKPTFPRSVEAIRNGVEVPPKKLLDQLKSAQSRAASVFGVMPEITDDDLPFQ